jgi:PEP-CTERM motif
MRLMNHKTLGSRLPLSAPGIVLGMALSGPAAALTTISFDDLAPGSVVGNQYAAQGVTFSANAFSGAGSSSSGQAWATNSSMVVASLSGVSGTDFGAMGNPVLASGNFLRRYVSWLDEDGDASFLMSFSTPINSISVTFAGVSGALNAPDTRMWVYNGNTLLALLSNTLPNSSTGQYNLSFAGTTITHVAVAPGSYNDWVAVDNIVFQAAVVPEPGTYALMALGLAGMGLLGRRRRQA